MEAATFVTRMPSETTRRLSYDITVDAAGVLHCSCPDHEFRGRECKHLRAAAPHVAEYVESVVEERQAAQDRSRARAIEMIVRRLDRLDVVQSTALAAAASWSRGDRLTLFSGAFGALQEAAKSAITDIRASLREVGIEVPDGASAEQPHAAGGR